MLSQGFPHWTGKAEDRAVRRLKLTGPRLWQTDSAAKYHRSGKKHRVSRANLASRFLFSLSAAGSRGRDRGHPSRDPSASDYDRRPTNGDCVPSSIRGLLRVRVAHARPACSRNRDARWPRVAGDRRA